MVMNVFTSDTGQRTYHQELKEIGTLPVIMKENADDDKMIIINLLLHSGSNAVQKFYFPIVHQLDDKLTEEGILPCKP